MKNVRESQLKTCILVTNEEFDNILSEVTSNMVTASYELDGITYDANYSNEVIPEDEIEEYTDEYFYQDITKFYKKLADYFGVKEVTSIHTDDCEYPVGIWICYKN